MNTVKCTLNEEGFVEASVFIDKKFVTIRDMKILRRKVQKEKKLPDDACIVASEGIRVTVRYNPYLSNEKQIKILERFRKEMLSIILVDGFDVSGLAEQT